MTLIRLLADEDVSSTVFGEPAPVSNADDTNDSREMEWIVIIDFWRMERAAASKSPEEVPADRLYMRLAISYALTPSTDFAEKRGAICS